MLNRRPALVLMKLIEAARRRRVLMIVAFVIVTGISIGATRLLPQTYVTRALLQLQESGRGSVLRDATGLVPDRMQERLAGLQALVQSNHVLRRALEDLEPERAQDLRWLETEMVLLRRALTLDLVGTDFLQFQLRGQSSAQLGPTLEAVTTRFLEALMPDRKGATAVQIVFDRRQDDVVQAEALVSQLKSQLSSGRLPEPAATLRDRASLEADEAEKAAELDRLDRRIAALGEELGIAQIPLNRGSFRRAKADSYGDGTDGDPFLAEQQTRLAQLRQLSIERGLTETELNKLRSKGAGLLLALEARRDIERKLAHAEGVLERAREAYANLPKRFVGLETLRNASILNAPERILVIDPPQTPTAPAVSRLTFVLAGVLAGLALAIGLAVGAELLDPVLYRGDDLAQFANVPLLAQLPHVPHAASPRRADQGHDMRRTYARAAALILLAILTSAYLEPQLAVFSFFR